MHGIRMIRAIVAMGLFAISLAVPTLSSANEIHLVSVVEARDYIVMDPPANFHTDAIHSGIDVVKEHTLDGLGMTVVHVRISGDAARAFAKFPDIEFDVLDDAAYELVD